MANCCNNSNISPACNVLCTYDARMSHMRALASVCKSEMSKLLKCAVGGRNHSPCCEKRGVPPSCMNLCSGVIKSEAGTPAVCMPYIGNIVMCLEEGEFQRILLRTVPVQET